MTTYKDFLGINICIYDPILGDTGAIGGNSFGYDGKSIPLGGGVSAPAPFYTDAAGTNNVSKLAKPGPSFVEST